MPRAVEGRWGQLAQSGVFRAARRIWSTGAFDDFNADVALLLGERTGVDP